MASVPRSEGNTCNPRADRRAAGHLAAARPHDAFERPRSRARRVAHDPKIYRAALFSQRKRGDGSHRAGPGGHDRNRRTHGHHGAQQPPDRGRSAAHGRRSLLGRGRRHQRVSFAGLADFSNDLLRLVAELTQQASFPADEFERERRQLLEGLKIERTTPGFLGSERLRRVLFGTHPYGTISPTEAQVEAYRLEQLKDFYRQYYRPGNALLVMVGDFSPQDMLARIEEIFGSWAAGKVEEAPNPALAGIARPEGVPGASAGIRADASAGRQSGDHAQASGLAAADACEFDLRRRV